jgi:hypothetical protein
MSGKDLFIPALTISYPMKVLVCSTPSKPAELLPLPDSPKLVPKIKDPMNAAKIATYQQEEKNARLKLTSRYLGIGGLDIYWGLLESISQG